MSVINKIHHYQRSIEKCGANLDRILHCITKLYNLPVTVQHLQETGVGRTVNGLRKYDGAVGDAAKALVAKWKAMVVDEYSSGEEEDEVSVKIENCTNNHDAIKLEEADENILDEAQELKNTLEELKDDEMNIEQSITQLSKSKEQSPKDMEEKHGKHEKSSHSSKHLQSEIKSKESKNSKSSLKKDEAHKSREHNHSKNGDLEKNDRLTKNNENSSGRRTFDSSSLKKDSSSKRSKLSDSGSNNETQLFISEKTHSSKSSETKIKADDDKDKSNVKQEKRSSQEESRSSSSKLKSQDSNSKIKDSSERHKHKKDHADHKKTDNKRDSSHHSSKDMSESKVSSSSKDHVKSKDRDRKREHKKDKDHHEKKKETKMRLSQGITSNEGIDCNSGASFAEALGMCTMPQPSRKRNQSSSNSSSRKTNKTEVTSPPSKKKMATATIEPECSDDPNPPPLLASNVKLEPLNVDLASTLPEISPNYKPLPHINPVQRKEEAKFVEDIILVKNQRTKVYSGNKVGYTSVPSLCELSMRVLIENIDALEFTGGVPYDIIKPVLERATPDQLFTLEHYNPYLIEDTGTLWQFHCNREFRNKQRQEMESWREMYMRCLDEREAKLKTLTANIKQSIDKSVPVRSAKLAYVDNVVKPPRNVLKKQAKYGTANDTPATVSSLKKKLTGGGGTNNATNIAVPPPPMSRFKMSTSNNVKKTKAPLMAKALQLIKGRYKR